MAHFYPDVKNLFTETLTGRRLSYTPTEVAEQFIAYIEDLQANPMEVETLYMKRRQNGNDDGARTAEGQQRKQNFYRAPKISDFVCRWLGKTMDWWGDIEKSKRAGRQFSDIKRKIEKYCYDAKLDGAIVGIYNANIISRDLGLKDKFEIDTRKLDQRTPEEVEESIARYEEMRKLATEE